MGPQNQGFWPKINCSQMKLPNFVSSSGDGSSKIGHDFSNKVVQKLKLSINHFYKKCAYNNYSSMKKKLALFDQLSLDGDTKFDNFI